MLNGKLLSRNVNTTKNFAPSKSKNQSNHYYILLECACQCEWQFSKDKYRMANKRLNKQTATTYSFNEISFDLFTIYNLFISNVLSMYTFSAPFNEWIYFYYFFCRFFLTMILFMFFSLLLLVMLLCLAVVVYACLAQLSVHDTCVLDANCTRSEHTKFSLKTGLVKNWR